MPSLMIDENGPEEEKAPIRLGQIGKRTKISGMDIEPESKPIKLCRTPVQSKIFTNQEMKSNDVEYTKGFKNKKDEPPGQDQPRID
jgi:hypothetical protein